MKELIDGDVVHGITVNKEELQKRRLFIATPMARGDCKGVYAASLARLFHTLGKWEIPFQYQYLTDDGLITRARNRLSVEFLNSSCTDILMLDSDIGFMVGDILVMMAVNRPFVSASYPLSRINWEKVKEAAGTHTAEELKEIACSDFVLNYGLHFDCDRLSRVPEAGGGCNLVSRSVFKDLMHCFGNLRYRPRKNEPSYEGYGWDFFGAGVDSLTGYYEPEDYMFCKKYREMGGEIWLCPWVTLEHVGEVTFKGNMKYAFMEGAKFNFEKVG